MWAAFKSTTKYIGWLCVWVCLHCYYLNSTYFNQFLFDSTDTHTHTHAHAKTHTCTHTHTHPHSLNVGLGLLKSCTSLCDIHTATSSLSSAPLTVNVQIIASILTGRRSPVSSSEMVWNRGDGLSLNPGLSQRRLRLVLIDVNGALAHVRTCCFEAYTKENAHNHLRTLMHTHIQVQTHTHIFLCIYYTCLWEVYLLNAIL